MILRELSLELTAMWNVDLAVWYRFTDVTGTYSLHPQTRISRPQEQEVPGKVCKLLPVHSATDLKIFKFSNCNLDNIFPYNNG
jgi:hypothetical protein